MKKPFISIITPSYNRGHIIHETADSIINQTYQDWEWIVVDDGSTDDTIQTLSLYTRKDSRIKFYKRDREPKGGNVCRNIGIEQSSGEYLIFLDSDDLLATFCLDKRAEAVLKYPDYDFLVFPMLLFKNKPDDLKILWNVETGEDDLLRFLRADPIWGVNGPIWKKKSLTSVGSWREDLLVWQDLELDLRALLSDLKCQKFLNRTPDTFIRVSDISVSRTGYHSAEKLKSRIDIFEYAINETHNQNILEHFSEGLKVMFYDLLQSGLKYQHWVQINRLLSVALKYNLLFKEELTWIKHSFWLHRNQRKIFITPWKKLNYYLFSKTKGYISRKLKNYIPAVEKKMGKILWDMEVVI